MTETIRFSFTSKVRAAKFSRALRAINLLSEVERLDYGAAVVIQVASMGRDATLAAAKRVRDAI